MLHRSIAFLAVSNARRGSADADEDFRRWHRQPDADPLPDPEPAPARWTLVAARLRHAVRWALPPGRRISDA